MCRLTKNTKREYLYIQVRARCHMQMFWQVRAHPAHAYTCAEIFALHFNYIRKLTVIGLHFRQFTTSLCRLRCSLHAPNTLIRSSHTAVNKQFPSVGTCLQTCKPNFVILLISAVRLVHVSELCFCFHIMQCCHYNRLEQ